MHSNLDPIVELLAARYDDLGRAAGVRLREWLSGSVPIAYPEILEKHLVEEHIDLLFDAFWQVLPVGTGGRRGRVGYGANRLNPTTVAMTVQGHCNYLREAFPHRDDLVVVVANDVREFHDIAGTYRFLGADHPLLGASSRSLGRLACEIYAANGIRAYFAKPRQEKAVLSTPELAYLISELDATGGINLSASHNPPDDNGVKIYDEFGSQPIAPQDQHLVEAMDRATDVKSMPFDEALEADLVLEIPDALHGKYIATYVDLYGAIHTPTDDVPVVYTPMCGCGGTTILEVLTELGFPVLVPDGQGEPDGTFEVIPFKVPNPEVPQSTEPAKVFADAHGSGIVLSSDPDADRVGLEIKKPDGSWMHFDGNQIAAVFCYYLMLDPEGPQRRGLVIETLVTTKILGEIVRRAGDSFIVDDLLVGFKYVADVLKTLGREGTYREVTCSPDQLVLAAEESHGVICIPTIRDKDATPACMYLAALYQRLASRGETLLDYYVKILEELGSFDSVNRSIMLSGAQGMLKKDAMMASLRENPPTSIAGHAVNEVVDYWDTHRFGPFVSDTDRLPRNVVQAFTDAFVLTVRPSGTEPKLKLYCQLLPHGEPSATRGAALLDEVRAQASEIARIATKEMLSRVGLELGEAGLLLPDIIDFDQKRKFEYETAPALGDSIAAGSFSDLDALLEWLREQCAAMTPGADPLPALKGPIAYLCGQWAASPLRDELLAWATR